MRRRERENRKTKKTNKKTTQEAAGRRRRGMERQPFLPMPCFRSNRKETKDSAKGEEWNQMLLKDKERN
jgi:hypothetical protein